MKGHGKLLKHFSLIHHTIIVLLNLEYDFIWQTDLIGETIDVEFDLVFPGYEEICLTGLKKLRCTKFYKKELLNSYLLSTRKFESNNLNYIVNTQ